MAITITADGHVLDKKLTVQQGGAAIVGATSILGNTGITGDLGVTGDFGTSGGLSAGGGVSSWGDITAVGGMSAGGDSSFAGDVSIDGAVSTLNPVLIEPEDESPPLVLGEQAQGQWVEGFNADLLDGLDSTDFMQRATNGTVSAVHTFSPVSVGPAFNLGANAKGQWVDGLNSDYLDGLHGSSFLKLATAQTITARHAFNPAVAGAPFTLGVNAQWHTVTGFDADTLDGNHASAFATSLALENYLPLSGGTLSGNVTLPTLYFNGTTKWSEVQSGVDLQFNYGATNKIKFSGTDGKIFASGGADLGSTATVYAKHFNASIYSGNGYFGAVYVGSSPQASLRTNSYGSPVLCTSDGKERLVASEYATITYNTDLWVSNGDNNGKLHSYEVYTHGAIVKSMTVDTDLPENDKWGILNNSVAAYKAHNIDLMHPVLKKSSFEKKLKKNKNSSGPDTYEDVPVTGYNIADLLQIAVECIAELRTEVNALKGI